MAEIEEKFFEVFGVDNCSTCDRKKSLECYYCDNKYPEITDRILLELICILSDLRMSEQEFYKIKTTEFNTLKRQILGDCLDYVNFYSSYIKQQIRALFEEGAEDE